MSHRLPDAALHSLPAAVAREQQVTASVAVLRQCLTVLTRHLVAAEQASADAVAEVTHRLVDVQRRCDALQAEMGAAVDCSRALSEQARRQAVRQHQALDHLARHTRLLTRHGPQAADEQALAPLKQVANAITTMCETPGQMAHQLNGLSESMDLTMQDVRSHILETLGSLQFQDITRQLLEQVQHGLSQLGDHCEAMVRGESDAHGAGSPDALRALLDDWEARYVMHQQRSAHQAVLAAGGDPGLDAEGHPADAAADGGAAAPRIELF